MTHLVIVCAKCHCCCPYQDSVEVAQRIMVFGGTGVEAIWFTDYFCKDCRP